MELNIILPPHNQMCLWLSKNISLWRGCSGFQQCRKVESEVLCIQRQLHCKGFQIKEITSPHILTIVTRISRFCVQWLIPKILFSCKILYSFCIWALKSMLTVAGGMFFWGYFYFLPPRCRFVAKYISLCNCVIGVY